MKKIIKQGAVSRIEEIEDIRCVFEQRGYSEVLLTQLRDVALEYLPDEVAAKSDAELTTCQKSAKILQYACTKALEIKALPVHLLSDILRAYPKLALDDVATATAPLIAKSDALGTVVKKLRSEKKRDRNK